MGERIPSEELNPEFHPSQLLQKLLVQLKDEGFGISKEGKMSWNKELPKEMTQEDIDTLEDELSKLISQLSDEKIEEIFSSIE